MGVPAGQARAHLLAYAGMTGELCLVDGRYQRVPAGRKVPHDRAAELARRYLTGHAPASVEDFAAWSGLPMSVARPAFPTDQRPVEEGPVPRVKLLGHFDPYLLGYKDRGFALDPAYAKRVQRGGGFVQAVVLVDGRVAGTWGPTWRGDTGFAWSPGLTPGLIDPADEPRPSDRGPINRPMVALGLARGRALPRTSASRWPPRPPAPRAVTM